MARTVQSPGEAKDPETRMKAAHKAHEVRGAELIAFTLAWVTSPSKD